MLVSDFPLYRYRATVLEIKDGDTFHVFLDFGDDSWRKRRIRLKGYDAPKLTGGSELGAAAKAALEAMCPVGSRVYLVTDKDAQSFERLLAVGRYSPDGVTLRRIDLDMIAAGHDTGRRWLGLEVE